MLLADGRHRDAWPASAEWLDFGSSPTMTFGILFLLLLVASGWWLYSRWSELRDTQARRRAAEMLYIFEARPSARSEARPAVVTASGFGPTLPEAPLGPSANR